MGVHDKKWSEPLSLGDAQRNYPFVLSDTNSREFSLLFPGIPGNFFVISQNFWEFI